MTKEEFELEYQNKSNISKEEYDKYFETLPCSCDYLPYRHWATVRKETDMIRMHKELYA